MESLVGYLEVAGYDEMFTAAGFGKAVEMARAGAAREELLSALPPEAAATVGLVGDADAIGARLVHELRHTFGTQMAAAGAPLRAIQEWMGHADAKTTQIYADYAADENNGTKLVENAFGENLDGDARDATATASRS